MSWTRKDWLFLAAILGVAILYRFYHLGVLPPGFQFDEAYNALDAQAVLAGSRPLFLPANAGREVLYTYWQVLLIQLFGFNIFTLRLASAIFGVIAVGVAYVLVRRLIQRESRLVAAGTALALAISIWHIHFSRFGIRVITMPILFSLAFGLAWLGAHATTRRARLWSYIGSGFFTGLSVWTHPTGRLAPFILIAFTAWLLWRYPARRRLGWNTPLGGLLISGIVAFLVFLPLGIEFLRHPEYFYGHASEVSIFAERVSGDSPVVTLRNNILHVLGMFSFAGDMEWTHGLAGRPVFDWPLALVYYGGLALAVLRLRPGQRDQDADALALFVIWSAVMLFPSILSDAAPNYSRTLPALPALFVPAGMGLAWLIRQRRPFPRAGIAAAALILLYSAGQMTYDYFVRFAQRPEVYYLYDVDKLDALRILSDYTDDHQVYLSQLWGDRHSTVRMLRQELGIKSLDTADTLVLPPPGQGAIYAFPHEQQARAAQLAALWPDVAVQTVHDPYDRELIHIVQITPTQAENWPADKTPTATQVAAFADAPTLLGMQADQPDKQVTLFWQAAQPIATSLTSFAHLLDADGNRVAQVDKLPGNGSYPTTAWTPGERVIDRNYPAYLDPCAGGEPLTVKVGWYELRDGLPQRPRADSFGTTAAAGTVTLIPISFPAARFAPTQPRSLPISPTLSLTGYTLHAPDELQPGSPLTLDLIWHSVHLSDAAPRDLALTLALTRADLVYPVWQGSLAPGAAWSSDQSLCRRVRASLPLDLEPATYTLHLVVGEQRVDLGDVALSASTRRFDVPPLARTVNSVFTDPAAETGTLRLLGMTAAPELAPDRATLTVELVWQSDARPAVNVNAFVHLLDASGAIVAQSDAPPGGAPATRRLPGEVILDRHALALPPNLPPGDYQLIAGLYDAVGMQRLTAYQADGAPWPENRAPLGSWQAPPP